MARITGQIPDETPSEALGRFLRDRRESLAPENVGLASRRGRRTPGLRREEVAFLADIGVKWYARLEAGHEIHPSEATLNAVAVALQLSDAEFEYLLDLAGLRHCLPSHPDEPIAIPEPLQALLRGLNELPAAIIDRINTPLLWNAFSDDIFHHSRFAQPVERNMLVRALFDEKTIAVLGEADRESAIARAVGNLRLNLASQRPSPFAAPVYERVREHPLFRRAWRSRIVSGEIAGEQATIRNHPREGQLVAYLIDLGVATLPYLLVRTLVPADQQTSAKFERIARRVATTCEIAPAPRLSPADAPATLA